MNKSGSIDSEFLPATLAAMALATTACIASYTLMNYLAPAIEAVEKLFS